MLSADLAGSTHTDASLDLRFCCVNGGRQSASAGTSEVVKDALPF